MNTQASSLQPDAHLTPIFLGSAAFVFLNFGLPIYSRSLGANAVAIGGMYTAFTFTMLLLRPVVGWALDRFGRRWFFTSAFVFYCISMLVFSQSTTIIDFYIARALQGIGASLMWISARTMVGDLAQDSQRGRQMGRITVNSVRGSMVGAFYGFTLLGMMPVQQAWSLAFAGYSLAALVGLVLALLRVRETAPEPTGESSSRLVKRLKCLKPASVTDVLRKLSLRRLVRSLRCCRSESVNRVPFRLKTATSVNRLSPKGPFCGCSHRSSVPFDSFTAARNFSRASE